MPSVDAPAWRRAFDSVERRLSPRIAATTSSPDLQVLGQTVRRAADLVSLPIGNLTAWGLHVAGLPTHGDVRQLRRQLGEVQRDILALRRSLEAGQSNGREEV